MSWQEGWVFMIKKSMDHQGAFADVMYSITEFKKKVLVLSARVLSP